MRRLLLLLLPVLLFAACTRVPDHARYIPKTAVSVLGFNTRSMGKKVAWNKLTGTDLLPAVDSALQTNGSALKTEDLKESGIDLASTLYLFFTTKGSLASYQSAAGGTAILPIGDSPKWEAFLKKSFPQVHFSDQSIVGQAGFVLSQGRVDDSYLYRDLLDSVWQEESYRLAQDIFKDQAE